MVVFTDICVCGNICWHLCTLIIHFSVSWSSEMQCDVIYLEISCSTQTFLLHSQPLNFVLVSLFLMEHTWHLILLHCIRQWQLCLVSSLFSCLIDGACLPCLSVKMLSVEGSLLMLSGLDCRNPLGPPVNLWTTGTESQQFVLSVHCMKFVFVTSPISLSVITDGKNYFN
jgi:hypothetical protein